MNARWLILGAISLFLSVGPLPVGGHDQAVHPNRDWCRLLVENDRCVFDVPADGGQQLVIVTSLSRKPGPFRVRLSSKTIGQLASAREHHVAELPKQIQDYCRRWKRSTHANELESVTRPAASTRVFSLFVKENDLQNPENYVSITADLKGRGRYCQVYVDRDTTRDLDATIAYLIHLFDEEIYPRARESMGVAADVDRDGRFSLLLSDWLGKMANGKVALGGFVRGSDFQLDLPQPMGNRCDMMYLNAAIEPGPHLRTLVAHEYTHAVIFSARFFGDHFPELRGQDEEGWLNEGLAHLGEDLHEQTWSNLDYRISAYLNAPERYQLVVPDYYSAGLWRSHGHRGATYLFLSSCVDRFGNDLFRQLVQTNLCGTTNVEVAAKQNFDDLLCHWARSLASDGMKRSTLGPLGRYLLCGPRRHTLDLDGQETEIMIGGTASAYVHLHSSSRQARSVSVEAEPGTNLAVQVIRLPDDQPRLTLTARRDGSHVVLAGSTRGGDVRILGASWERLTPSVNHGTESARSPAETASEWFAQKTWKPGEVAKSCPIPIPDVPGGIVFKILAQDQTGRRLGAWADLVPIDLERTHGLR